MGDARKAGLCRAAGDLRHISRTQGERCAQANWETSDRDGVVAKSGIPVQEGSIPACGPKRNGVRTSCIEAMSSGLKPVPGAALARLDRHWLMHCRWSYAQTEPLRSPRSDPEVDGDS
jgi:hypothetical protein